MMFNNFVECKTVNGSNFNLIANKCWKISFFRPKKTTKFHFLKTLDLLDLAEFNLKQVTETLGSSSSRECDFIP